MRDVYEVLREKEKAIQRVDQEIRLLRLAASLLNDGTDSGLITDDPRRDGTEATEDAKVGTAKRISARLRRLATPLLEASRSAS
ncbi:MAG: hypothetical protein LAO56_09655 [Acidobacteriia bacterium]|nr:hypothetical protein [Terriglobia bacterium]